MCGSGSSMVGGQQQQKTKTKNNQVELEASLAPAEAEVGAVAKADQKDQLLKDKQRWLHPIKKTLVNLNHGRLNSFEELISIGQGFTLMRKLSTSNQSKHDS